ncbi:ribonuclease H-like domain-containing protein [Tanacetum coccineum]|uniref:Ribonuclease H-like domain-containing protein n=1 Tax=Tanacetum coccineum TaxID=301880 RepID=A0ABQ5BX47_9ASTR
MSTHPMVTRTKADIFKPLERMHCHVTTTSQLPHSHVHALCDPNWKEVMLDEYNALITNGTWVLVPRPTNVNVVRSMWLFKHKFNADGSLNRYKARLIANGRSQQQGIDCDETFSPVVKPATIRTVLSLVVSRDWPIHQLDVKNAFLHGHLSETVYMHQPPGFVDPNKPDFVCHLQRSLYGFKQASRAWFQRFASYATRVEEILERAHMQHCNPCKTPVDTESKLGSDGDPVSDPTLYRSLAAMVRGTLDMDFSFISYPLGTLLPLRCCDWAGCLLPIRNLLLELHASLTTATLVYCDNVSAVYLSTNPVQHQRTKHIEIDIHFVRDYVASGQVRVLHVPSRFQYANIFTKGLPSALFLEFRSSLNVRRPPAQTAGEY